MREEMKGTRLREDDFLISSLWRRLRRKLKRPRAIARLDNRMADEKKSKAKTEKPAGEKAAKPATEAKSAPETKSGPESKSAPETKTATETKAEAPAEAKSEAPKNYSRGEGQKAVTQAYKDNWNTIFGKKKR